MSKVKQFEVGKTYWHTFIGDSELVARYTVTGRTDKTVTLKPENGKAETKRIAVRDGEETVKPLGSHSMAPVLRAGNIIKSDKAHPHAIGDRLRVQVMYGDAAVGSEGDVDKVWTDKSGNHWVRLYFGKNLTGQKLQHAFPIDVLEPATQGRFSSAFNLDRNKIFLDPALFQGRQGAHSTDTVAAIVAKGHYDRSGDPIVVWLDPIDGRHYVISGHSRWEAAKQLYESGKQPDLATVPVKRFMGDLDEAIDYAVLESNRASSEEGLISDLAAYRRAVERGLNRNQLLGIFKPESRLRRLRELSFLNPKGQFIEMLAGTQSVSFPYLERNAGWVGVLRSQLPSLTNAHEQEIFDYLYKDSQKGLKLSKDQFFKLISDRVNRLDFDPSMALNLHDRVSASAYTDPIIEQIADLNRTIERHGREIEAKRALIVRARSEGKDEFIPKLNERISELNREIIRLIEQREDLRQKAGRIERTMTADLFSDPEAAPLKAVKKEPEKPEPMKPKTSISDIDVNTLDFSFDRSEADETRKSVSSISASTEADTAVITVMKGNVLELADHPNSIGVNFEKNPKISVGDIRQLGDKGFEKVIDIVPLKTSKPAQKPKSRDTFSGAKVLHTSPTYEVRAWKKGAFLVTGDRVKEAPVKAAMKLAGAGFNPRLKVDGKLTFGYIVEGKTLEEVIDFVQNAKAVAATTPKGRLPGRYDDRIRQVLEQLAEADPDMDKKEVLEWAARITEMRDPRSVKNDNAKEAKAVLDPTYTNLLRWAVKPGRYDLRGVDIAASKPATVEARLTPSSFFKSLGIDFNF